jgi:hypothetical protein
MDKEHIKGAADKAKGAVKDTVVQGDRRQEDAGGRKNRQGEGNSA